MVDAVEVSSIKINTGYAGVKEYPIFSRPDGKAGQCAIILGGNGTGKSTIARALSGGNKLTEFFDSDGKSLGSDCSNIHVFNESYVIKNFRTYKPGYLEPVVVLLGKTGAIVDDIERLEKEVKELEDRACHIKNMVFSRVVKENSSVLETKIGNFVLGDYVSACIINELDGIGEYTHISGISDGGYIFDSLISEDEIDEEMYLRWIDLECVEARTEIYSIKNPDEYNEELEEYHRAGSSESIEQLNETLQYNDDFLRGFIYEAHNVDDYNVDTFLAVDDIRDYRRSCAYDLMSFLYKFYPKMYYKIDNGFSDTYERSMYQDLDSKIQNLRNQIDQANISLENEKRKESARDVIKYINQWLSLVFGKDGMYVEYADLLGYAVKFKVEGKEETVSPNMLSVGEQNILSLCYFLATTVENKNISEIFQENEIIVLDDPVSSFDDSNKYGVTSLLGYLCQSILNKASKTKLVIMTHDLSFAFSMSKMINAIDSNRLSCWELQKDSSSSLVKSKFEDIDKYSGILRSMYDFALQEEKSLTAPPPNDVRRVWEAFLSFELGETSIANMGSLKKLSEYFSKNQKVERFMRVFIPQLFINNDSHAKSQVMNGNLYLTPTLDGKPYEDFVKNIVCFMHIVSPRHIAWRMQKTSEENVQDFVVKLDNLVREVLDDPKVVAATSSWRGYQGLRRARHRGGRVSLEIRRQSAGR